MPLPRLTARLLAPLFAVTALSCSSDGPVGPGDPPEIASITVTPGADTLVTVGRTRQFVAIAREADGTPIPGVVFAWSTPSTAVATVDADGLVTAVAGGTATITATADGISGDGTLAVVQFVAGVQVTPPSAALDEIGETQAFSAVAKDSSGATVPGVKFLWVSADPDVATVDTLGVATATGPGEILVSATGRGTPGYAELAVTQDATQLAFTIHPANASAGAALSPAIQVEIRDAGGHLVADSRAPVTLQALGGPGNATLTGSTTVNAVGGVATFSGLSIATAGADYVLHASADGLAETYSDAFTIAAGPLAHLEIEYPSILPFEALVPSPHLLYVSFRDAFGNPTEALEPFLDLIFDGPPDERMVLTYQSSIPGGPGSVYFENLILNRPTNRVRIRARAGGVTVVSPPLTVGVAFTQVSAGQEHVCGIASGGTFCWGSNAEGALGRGSSGISVTRDSLPMGILSTVQFTQIASAQKGTCGLTGTGAAYCWGDGISQPTQVTGTGSGGVVLTSITKGTGHACGLTSAGAVYCWGSNFQGQLGDGSNASSPSPVLVSGSGTGSRIFTAVSAGSFFTCGVTTLTTAYCWGANSAGVLGDSTLVAKNAPVQVAGSGSGLRSFVGIDAGLTHVCAISFGGGVLCWGSGSRRQLGFDVLEGYSPVPGPVNLGFGPAIVEISAGGEHTCAIASDTSMRCWGDNHFGQVGQGMTGDMNGALANFVDLPGAATGVTTGHHQTCTMVTGAGAYCWGRNLDGELGIGTLAVAISFFPVRVIQ